MWVEFLHIFSGSFLDAKVGQTTVQINILCLTKIFHTPQLQELSKD